MLGVGGECRHSEWRSACTESNPFLVRVLVFVEVLGWHWWGSGASFTLVVQGRAIQQHLKNSQLEWRRPRFFSLLQRLASKKL
jgi:hypothetical protein